MGLFYDKIKPKNMKNILDKIFTPVSLIIFNIFIILSAEFLGGGELFFKTGIIHIIAGLFIVLGVSRVFLHRSKFDPWLEKFVHTVIIALIIFSVSHFIEFLSLVVLKAHYDSSFVAVVNFYLMSILAIVAGAEILLKRYNPKRNWFLGFLPWVALILIAFFTIALLLKAVEVSLEPDSLAVVLYMVVSVLIGAYGLISVHNIGKVTSVIRPFAKYVFASILLVVIAIVPNILYEIFEDFLGIAERQSVYISHFTFYAALSILFLSFRKLNNLGGIYDDLAKIQESDKTK
jgi:hypothetical protein